jgi:2-polyprenyl-6-methoxyphenol hydroxylase-like FAD-dependent oxidoreductase
MLRPFAEGLKNFEPFTLLSAKADRVKEWAQDGLVLIGDAAHTCSPAGAVGVSVAVETAIVAADVIAEAFEKNDFTRKQLARIQERREKAVEETQTLQSRVALLISARNPVVKAAAFAVFLLLAKTRLFIRIQRRLMVSRGPLPFSPSRVPSCIIRRNEAENRCP